MCLHSYLGPSLPMLHWVGGTLHLNVWISAWIKSRFLDRSFWLPSSKKIFPFWNSVLFWKLLSGNCVCIFPSDPKLLGASVSSIVIALQTCCTAVPLCLHSRYPGIPFIFFWMDSVSWIPWHLFSQINFLFLVAASWERIQEEELLGLVLFVILDTPWVKKFLIVVVFDYYCLKRVFFLFTK